MDEDSDNYYDEDNYEADEDKDKETFNSSAPNKGVSSSVQEFLKQSNEIQEEIRKLSELCQQISPKKDSFIEEVPRDKEDYDEGEHVIWEQINNLLTTHGFNTLALIQDDYDQDIPDPSSAQDLLVQLITEYSNLSRSFEELSSAYKELDAEYKSKCQQADKSRTLEEKVKNLDKINRQLQEKLSKQQEPSKPQTKAQTSRPRGVPDRCTSVFKAFMEQDYNPNRDNDAKIMAIIQNYEDQNQRLAHDLNSSRKEMESLNHSYKKYKEKSIESDQSYTRQTRPRDEETNEKLKVLQNIVNQLSLKSYTEVPSAINKLQQVMMTLPGIDKFVKQICEEIMISPGSRLEEVLESLREIKRKVLVGEKFRSAVFDQMNVRNEGEVFDRVKGLLYFCKLFEIKPRDDLVSAVESIFFFVHEIKMFLGVRVM